MLLTTLFKGGEISSLTSFISVAYFAVFLPICLILYALIPQRFKRYYLLLISAVFFWLISGKLIVYIILAVFSMHYFGLWLDRLQTSEALNLKTCDKEERKGIKKEAKNKQRGVVILAGCILFGVLLVLKYSAFFTVNINTLLKAMNINAVFNIPNYLLPIGISFFTLQAMSYIFDVYNKTVKADDNILRLALFICFFPQIVEGPICRYNQTADKLWNVGKIEFYNLTLGLERIAYGMMKKIVIADRLNPLVKNVFSNYSNYEGGVIALAAVCYTIQLYMDFSGAMDAVCGTAQIFSLKMPENFERPFFSKSISEFWKRWHITLGTWFKDYIFYPVVSSKPMKKLTSIGRKKLGNHYGALISGGIALFLVWVCNGLWHGAAWTFVFFGMYHFVLILSGNIIEPVALYVNKKLHIKTDSLYFKIFRIVRTGIIVVIGELFFRVSDLKTGFGMVGKIFTQFTFTSFNDSLLNNLGVDRYDLIIVAFTLIIVFLISLLNEKGIILREYLSNKSRALRLAVIYALILYIVVFGAYGMGYIPVDPLYANF